MLSVLCLVFLTSLNGDRLAIVPSAIEAIRGVSDGAVIGTRGDAFQVKESFDQVLALLRQPACSVSE